MKKLTLVMIGVLVALMIGLASFMMFAIFNGEETMNIFSSANITKRVSNASFSSSNIKEIQLNNSSMSIVLVPSDTEEIVVEEFMTSSRNKELADISDADGKLMITEGRHRSLFNWMWYGYTKIHIPKSWKNDIHLKSTSGGIRTEYDWEFAKFEAINSSGSIRLQSVKSDNDVYISSVSGGLSGNNIYSGGDVFMKSGSGSIKYDSIESSGKVELSDTSGAVDVGGLSCEGNLAVSNISGSIRLGKAEVDSAQVKSSSGGISLGEFSARQKVEAKSVSGCIKAESLRGEFNLECKSGGIDIQNADGHGKAKNLSGSIKLSMEKLTGDISAENTSGAIKLKVPEGSSFNFKAKTTSGSVHTPDDKTLDLSGERNNANGVCGDGGDIDVSLKNLSGSIYLEWI